MLKHLNFSLVLLDLCQLLILVYFVKGGDSPDFRKSCVVTPRNHCKGCVCVFLVLKVANEYQIRSPQLKYLAWGHHTHAHTHQISNRRSKGGKACL